MNNPHPGGRPPTPKRHQRGVVLLFSLIALTIMLIAAVALVRSFNTTLFSAGNIAFKRDMRFQSERAVQQVFAQFDTTNAGGALNSSIKRAGKVPASNYSAQILPANAKGIPDALQTNATFTAAGFTGADLTSSDGSIAIRYVVDRLCISEGEDVTLGPAGCTLPPEQIPSGSDLSSLRSAERASVAGGGNPPPNPQGVMYRLSVKVSGPRNTQSFFQSTFAIPPS